MPSLIRWSLDCVTLPGSLLEMVRIRVFASRVTNLARSRLPNVTVFIVTLVISSLLGQSYAVAGLASVERCEDIFNGDWVPGTIPLTIEHKLQYIEHGIRSKTRNSFTGMDIIRKEIPNRLKLEQYLEHRDFNQLTQNHLMIILSKIREVSFPAYRLLFGELTGHAKEMEENFNNVRFANELMKTGLFEFVRENGHMLDRGDRDRYLNYVQTYFSTFRFLLTTLNPMFAILQLINFFPDVKNLLTPEFNIIGMKYLKHPELENAKMKFLANKDFELILENGLVSTKENSRQALGKKSLFALNLHIVMKIGSITAALISLAILADRLSKKHFGNSPSTFLRDLVEGGYVESAAYLFISASLIEEDVKFDSIQLKAEIHRQIAPFLSDIVNKTTPPIDDSDLL